MNVRVAVSGRISRTEATGTPATTHTTTYRRVLWGLAVLGIAACIIFITIQTNRNAGIPQENGNVHIDVYGNVDIGTTKELIVSRSTNK